MGLSDWLGSVLRGMGWKAWVFVVLGLILALALPGVWAVQSFLDARDDTVYVSLDGREQSVEVDGVTYQAPDLTREAEVLREAFSHDATLIASIPTLTPTVAVVATVVGPGGTPVVALLSEHPEGIPVAKDVEGLDWFETDKGLHFYRDSGGDWTPPEVRGASPYRSLIEYGGYPEGVSNFADGSIVYELAVKLAFGMVEVRPAFGTPTPAMVAALARDLGWELVDVDEVPALRLWTNFTFRTADDAEYEYAVGGVMLMQLGELPDGAQYLIPGEFVEPGVVLQRLDVSR